MKRRARGAHLPPDAPTHSPPGSYDGAVTVTLTTVADAHLNGQATQTVQEGTADIVRPAGIGPGGPTGAFMSRHGSVPW